MVPNLICPRPRRGGTATRTAAPSSSAAATVWSRTTLLAAPLRASASAGASADRRWAAVWAAAVAPDSALPAQPRPTSATIPSPVSAKRPTSCKRTRRYPPPRSAPALAGMARLLAPATTNWSLRTTWLLARELKTQNTHIYFNLYWKILYIAWILFTIQFELSIFLFLI